MSDVGESSWRQAEEHDGTESEEVHASVWGARDPALTVPQGLWTAHHEPTRKRLVLHVDLNNTILVSDAVTCQGTLAALDYFLTTVTWGKKNKHGKHGWCFPAARGNARNVCARARVSQVTRGNRLLLTFSVRPPEQYFYAQILGLD